MIRIAAWACVLAATGLLVRAEVHRPELPEGVDAYRDLVYRTDGRRRVRLDLYIPRAEVPAGGWPTVVAIHGGGWRGGSRQGYGEMVARLAAPGPPGVAENGRCVVASIDYQLAHPGAPSWPANLEDVREAVRWLRRHAADYDVDPGRIAVMGASAGGHLAALLGTDPDGPAPFSAETARSSERESARVQAVIDFYGPTDLRALADSREQARRPIAMFLGGTAAEYPERYDEASPVRHVSPDDPPMLLIHGTDDALIPLEQSKLLVEALGSVGVEGRLVVVDEGKHGFGLTVGRRDLTPEILAFLHTAWNSPAKRNTPGSRP